MKHAFVIMELFGAENLFLCILWQSAGGGSILAAEQTHRISLIRVPLFIGSDQIRDVKALENILLQLSIY